MLEKTDYPDKEVILIDSGTTDPITLSLYREWSSLGGVSIIPFNEPFNYSMACNLGASIARGEHLLFLNNDIEMIDPGWLEELVRWAQLPGIGVVGTKLLYPDGKIQHAGVVFSTITSHVFSQQYDDLATAPTGAVFGTPSIYRNVTAVTGACQLLRRSLFDEIGGYDTRSVIAGSDNILCLRATKLGYRNLYTPYAALSTTRAAHEDGPILATISYFLHSRFVNSIFKKIPSFIPSLIPNKPLLQFVPHGSKLRALISAESSRR